jgi:hypothetical protein
MSYITDLLDKPRNLSTASKYTAMNGVFYLGTGALLVAWPGVTQTIFMDTPIVGHEGALIRVIGRTLGVIGWLYFFAIAPAGGKSPPVPCSTDWCSFLRCSRRRRWLAPSPVCC